MEDFEVLDGIADLFGDGEAAASEIASSEGSLVEDDAAVQEVANAPAIVDASSESGINNFIKNNKFANTMWNFSKKFGVWAVKESASAVAAFGIMYGLNKALAQDAHNSGNRKPLSQYLAQVEKTFTDHSLTWGPAQKQQAAEDALSFPWIDATQ